jgi:hypothetical protein
MMVLQRGMMLLLLVGVAAAAGFKKMEDIPDSCTPDPLVPDNGRCLFSYQCASGFCCPYFKSCLGDNGYEPLPQSAVEADPLRLKMMYTSEYGGEATCGSANGICDVCDMRDCSQQQTCDMCITVDAGDGAKPMLEGNDYNFPPYDIGDEKCRCHADFVAAWEAGTWVEGCSGGGSPSPAASSSDDSSSDDSSATTAAPAPPAAVASGSRRIHAEWAFGTIMLVAIAPALQVN